MAIRLTFSRPMAANVRPATPGVPRMFLPPPPRWRWLLTTVTCSTLVMRKVMRKLLAQGLHGSGASLVDTIKQMSFCEDDWEINSTLARKSAVVEKVRPTTSGKTHYARSAHRD